MTAEDAPQGLGGLLAVLGLVLIFAGAQISEQNGSYYVIVGIGTMLSGLLIFKGRKLALLVFGLTLATAWIWSLVDAGWDMGALVPRVGLLTLFGFYLFSAGTRSRLA